MILLGSFVEEPEPEDGSLLLAPLSGPEEKLEKAAFGLTIHQAPPSESFIRVGVSSFHWQATARLWDILALMQRKL